MVVGGDEPPSRVGRPRRSLGSSARLHLKDQKIHWQVTVGGAERLLGQVHLNIQLTHSAHWSPRPYGGPGCSVTSHASAADEDGINVL